MSQTKFRSPLMPKSGGKSKKKSSTKSAPPPEIEKEDFVEMRSETLPSRTVLASDREGRINYTLDMVVHDLITQGHVSASRAAYMLKSPEMKEHVGRICDEMARRRKEAAEASNKTPRPQTSALPTHLYQAHGPNQHGPDTTYNSAPSSDLALQSASPSNNAAETLVKTPSSKKRAQSKKRVTRPNSVQNSSTNTTQASESSQTIPIKPAVSEFKKKSNSGAGKECDLPAIRKKSVSKTSKTSKEGGAVGSDQRLVTPNKTKPASILKTAATESQIQNGILDDIPSTSHLNQIFNFPPAYEPQNADTCAYRTRVDLGGFTNDNISLDLDGRRLIIVAFRPKDRNQHARKITEIVDIPENVDLENLKIGRRLDGALIVEEMVNI